MTEELKERPQVELPEDPPITEEDIEAAMQQLSEADMRSREQIIELREKLKGSILENLAVLSSHALIVQGKYERIEETMDVLITFMGKLQGRLETLELFVKQFMEKEEANDDGEGAD